TNLIKFKLTNYYTLDPSSPSFEAEKKMFIDARFTFEFSKELNKYKFKAPDDFYKDFTKEITE
ncbi:7968_t:CDS:1, partial [Scutellospora calospora]